MAKFRRKVRRVGKSVKRSAKRYSSSQNPLKLVIPAMIYGASRSYISAAATPITSKLGFLGGYADEAVFGLAGWYAAKKGKGLVKSIGTAVLLVEAASLGSQLGGSLMNGVSSNSDYTSNY